MIPARLLTRNALPGHIDSAIRFLLYVLIFWLPYSPAVIEVCVIMGLVLWLIKRGCVFFDARKKGSRQGIGDKFLRAVTPGATTINKPIAFFICICIVSVLGSAFFLSSMHRLITKTLEWFVIFFLFIETFTKRKHVVIALSVLTVTAFSTALDAIYQLHVSYSDIFLGQVIKPGSRATAGFGTATSLGAYLAAVFPVIFSLWGIPKKRPEVNYVVVLVLLTLLWALVITYARGAWGATLLGLSFFFFLQRLKKRSQTKKGSLKSPRATVFIVAAVTAVIGVIIILLAYRLETVWWRFAVWKDALQMVVDRPFFGHGINTFMKLSQEYRSFYYNPTYAHNCFLQLTVEVGVVGLIGFIWIFQTFFMSSVAALTRIAGQRAMFGVVAGMMSGVLAYLAHSFFDTHFYSLQISALLWVLVGLACSSIKISESEFRLKAA